MCRKNISNYKYEFDPEMYKYILSTNILNKKKDEPKIFKSLVAGYSAKEIAKRYHYAESTIWNRRRDIYQKTKKYMKGTLSEKQKENILKGIKFKVYLLTFPNNKVYVGMSSDVEKRWNDGKGYSKQKDVYEAIINYGWNNIKKEILFEDLSMKEARNKEKEMIKYYDSMNKQKGYNRAK